MILEAFFVLRGVAWFFGTVWLGAVACVRGVAGVFGLRKALATTLCCPRGHQVPVFNVFTCGTCGAAFEGSVLEPCPTCGASAGWTPCPRCGLSVRNPIFGRRS